MYPTTSAGETLGISISPTRSVYVTASLVGEDLEMIFATSFGAFVFSFEWKPVSFTAGADVFVVIC